MQHIATHHSVAEELITLKSELQFIETRLRQMGYSGDCAYEKRMSKLYEEKALMLRSKMDSISYETGILLS